MLDLINKKVLITTQGWFIAPDGIEYRACWGTLKSVNEAGKTLGFIPNRSHANWFIQIGNMIIMGCQVMYVIECNEKPNFDKAKSWVHTAEKGVTEYDHPTKIYMAE